MGKEAFSMGVKQLGHENNHSPPSSAKVKNEWSNSSALPVCLHGMDRVNLTFFLNLWLVTKCLEI
jgi:hypothetical protein